MKKYFDVAVIGGGAAGLFALRGLKDKKTLLIERNSKLGAKLLITGGGKCNFTNKNINAANFVSANPHFVKSALSKFGTEDILEVIKWHKISFEERDNSKLFTLQGADKILEALLKDGASDKLEIQLATTVKEISKDGDTFKITTDKSIFEAKKVIVASGGLSFPKIGATDIGYKIAQKFGMRLVKTAPALTSLKYPADVREAFSSLSGISITASATIGKKVIKDQLLFTHTSFSAPLALNASLYLQDADEMTVDFAPALDIYKLIAENRSSKKSLQTILAYSIPKALVKELLGDREYSLAKIRKAEIDELHNAIKARKIKITERDGYNKAEVTRGGVSVDDVNQTTMESKTCKGLYFIGEALDVTGELGGYNLHWAWASANAAINGIGN